MKNSYNNYEDALKVLKMESLDERRSRLCLKFAKNCLKNDKMKKLFPLARSDHSMKTRAREKFKVHHAKTNRYRNSAIPYMQRLLNTDAQRIKSILA